MLITQIYLTHTIAQTERKPPFFFSRFNFDRMRKRGNTHYCFHCGGYVGFKPGKGKKPLNCTEESGYNPMRMHNPVTHADGVVGGANKFSSPWRWLEASIPANFPFIVTIPQV